MSQKMPGILQNCKFQVVTAFTTASSTVAANHSNDVDCTGFGSVCFFTLLGTVTPTSPNQTVLVGDTTAAYTTATGLTIAGSSIVNSLQIIDIPKIEKRYACVTLNTTTAGHAAQFAILYNPLVSPTTNSTATLGVPSATCAVVTT